MLFFKGREQDLNVGTVSYTHLDVYKRQLKYPIADLDEGLTDEEEALEEEEEIEHERLDEESKGAKKLVPVA